MTHDFDLSTFSSKVEAMVKKNASGDSLRERYSYLRISEYTPDEVKKIIDCGSLTEQQRLSRAFYEKDGLYKRIILYYATILKYEGIMIPHPTLGKKLSESFVTKKYYGALDYLDNLNLPELLTRISIKVLIDGCYYGVITAIDKNRFSIMDLPTAWCRSRYRDLEGNDIIEFNVEYFYSIIDAEERKDILKIYPKLISAHYRKHRDGKVNTPWVKIPADLGVCFPFFDDGRPLFLSVIPATLEYDDAVDTDRERDLEEIRKILVQKIPHLTDGVLLFEPQEAEVMHKGAVDMLKKNKNISVLTTYADVDAIVSKTTSDTVNNSVEKMLQHVYSEAGASVQLFSPTGSQALSTSITNDTTLMMVLGNKYARFIKYILNTVFGNANISFGYKMLPVTLYNQSEYITDSFKLAQSGYSFLIPSIALGINQKDLIDLKELENNVLKLPETLIPLSSAYTQSYRESANPVGGQEKALEEKAETTVVRAEETITSTGGSDA